MKKIVCLTAFLAMSFFAMAQLQFNDSVNISRERWRDSIFRIDKSAGQVPSGILLEYTMFPPDTSKFDGINNNDDTVKREGEIFALHNLLILGKVNGNTTLDITDSIYARANRINAATGANPFVLIYQPYNRIRQTALSEGLFKIAADSVGILDVANRPKSPYNSYNLFAVSPLKPVVSQFNAIPFSFPDELWLMPGITSVTVDFADGAGARTITKGSTVNIYYATAGTKIITVQINTASGIKKANTALAYSLPPSFVQPSYAWFVNAQPVYTNDNDYLNGTASPAPPFWQWPGVNAVVETGCDNAFDKPIIIVEGFDPDGSLTSDVMRTRFDNQALINTMKAAGYDFVFVNFTKNIDYIENNAKVLEAVINKVNQTKTGTTKSIVIGFSMGGLVARWCLKDMEQRGVAHNVQKYFSYDAPHQGANIPLGFQYLFGEVVRDVPVLRWFNIGGLGRLADAYESPAARQMLVTKGAYNNGPFNWNPSVTTLDPLRATFASRLKAKGYPTQTTNYGISFGRGNNTTGTKNAGNGTQWNNFQPGAVLFDGGMNWLLAGFNSSVYAVPENGNQQIICDYSFFGITFRKIFGIPIFPTVTIRFRTFRYTGQYPYDDAPGSYEVTGKLFARALSGVANGLREDADIYGHYGHNFVSVASALDLQNQGYSATNNWQSNNMYFAIDNQIVNPGAVAGNTLSVPAQSPFAYVMTATSNCSAVGCSSDPYTDLNGQWIYPPGTNWNQYHNGYLQNQTAQFMMRKILNAVPSFNCQTDAFCAGTSSPITITGTQVVCTTGSYTLQNLPNGVSVNWVPVNGLVQVNLGQGTNAITVQKSNTGNEIIRAIVTTSCGASKTFDFPIRVGGYGSSDYPVSGPGSACKNSYVTYVTNNLPFATGYTWFYPNGNWTYISGQNTYSITLRTGTTTGYYQVGVRAANACDAGGSYAFASTTVNNCGSFAINTAPNPATQDVTVSVAEQPSFAKSKGNDTKIYAIELVDQYGVARKRYRNAQGVRSYKFNVRDLASGSYFVRVYDGTRWSYQQVIVVK